jgi:hypothetical protein
MKKLLIFFLSFLLLSSKLGKQSLRFRAAKTFFFGITAFLCQNKNPADHFIYFIHPRIRYRDIICCTLDEESPALDLSWE